MTILDRYVLKKFAIPFLYCFFGFIAIWFVFDLSDNLPDFIEGKVGFSVLMTYYRSQIPELIVMTLPIVELLALLYALTAMSRSNEIISMLGAGLSLTRVLVPLIAVGLLLTGVTAYFNFESSPHAAATKKQMLKEIKRGKKQEPGLNAHLFRNRENLRTWFVQRLWLVAHLMTDVEIIQQNPESDITQIWYARRVEYDAPTKTWILTDARMALFNKAGDITHSENAPVMRIPGWSETPWRIASSVMNPDYLSVIELEDYLAHNADFPKKRLAPYLTHLHYRWALPTVCLLVIFIAGPLGVVYSRRGVLGGVATAIGLFFSLVFVSSLFIALGKGARIPPYVAAWGPIAIYGAIGLWLLWYRSTNRDLPKFKIPGF